MADKEVLIQTFVRRFVRKERRERSLFELMHPKKRSEFINRLNHGWEDVLEMKYLTQLSPEIESPEAVLSALRVKPENRCYVISSYRDYDDQFLPWEAALQRTYARGLATLLIDPSVDLLFLDTEQVQGAPPRFIGRVRV
ncbi:hypothetical protein SAMN05421823_10611 [Catalinimonas alkaloidigena]|uniref:Uncharacterized protein n=1 Tax=Catalinimonas alkaloidigena TaxID=1075417 RepID=A0A1G9K0H4_9BACT|nr:hypothetical protein [Catalinimonas alkaloidigena]SDL43278.1 hypothetical protein SAMN05421823_10611 [Catalinimonas alkaloidigena]